ncbi:MAG: glycosyltransferase family 4 protein [Proteobacteria bacterium]|nr:glycosyltransferase family 4 protein [Pseudomonadota bacterium]
MRICVVANSSWYVYNFRRSLIEALRLNGHEAIALAPEDAYSQRLRDLGIAVHAIPLDRGGTQPLRELATIFEMRRILRQQKIDVVLSYTPKGNLYAAFALLGRRAHQVMNVSGLGRAFIQTSWVTPIVRIMYRMTMERASWVFFQNDDDRRLFLESGMVDVAKTERIPGSGVDLQRFRPMPPSTQAFGRPPSFLMIARLLWDKGVGEFVEAARALRQSGVAARFQLLGPMDEDNPSAVPRHQLDGWVRDGLIDYKGATDDVRTHVAEADCVVLPSYREGVPRSLLEAAAMGKPLIASDAVGCRDAVDDGSTGFLCDVRSAGSLAEKMREMLRLPAEQRDAMGLRGREKMAREFDEGIVLDRYFAVLHRLA